MGIDLWAEVEVEQSDWLRLEAAISTEAMTEAVKQAGIQLVGSQVV